MFEQDQWFYMMQCSDLDQQSHRKWCYDTNQRCSISTMLQTTMMLWFWSTMSRMMMMFQYWSMMQQTMIIFRLHNLAKRMKTQRHKYLVKEMALESTMLKMEEKNEQMQRKGMSSTSTTQNYCKWYHHKHYSQARVWLHVIPCRVKTEYSVNDWNWHTMPPVQGNRPLSRVTGPCRWRVTGTACGTQ